MDGGGVLELDDGPRYCKCVLCDSVFHSLEEANKCCRRAKARVLYERLRQKYGREHVEYRCNVVRAGMLGRGCSIQGLERRCAKIECTAAAL